MKKLIITLAVLTSLIWPMHLFAAGTCTPVLSETLDTTGQTALNTVVTVSCTGDSSDGTYPSTAFSSAIMDRIRGLYLMTGSWKNGSTYPTANSTLTLSTTNEGDILGGAGKGPTTAAASAVSKFTPVTDTTYATAGLVPITADLTLQVTQAGSATNSAAVTLVFKFVK